MEVIKGRIKKPYNILVIGENGVGKSTLGAAAEKPIILGCEENDELEAERLSIPKDFKHFEAQLAWVASQKYRTLVIDTIDSVEQMRVRELLGKNSQLNWDKQSELEGDFIGIRQSLKEMRDKKGMNIILLAHCKSRIKTDTIHQADYDTTESSLRKSTLKVFGDWVSCILFATYKSYKKTDVKTEKTYVIGEGDRIFLTSKRPGHPGKNRYELPYELPFTKEDPLGPFLAGYEAFYAGQKRTPAQISKSITGLMNNIEDEKLLKAISDQLGKAASNIPMLEAIERRVKERVGA